MSKETVIWVTIVIYVAFVSVIGFLSSRKKQSLANFMIGSRNAGGWVSALSYGAAYFSAVMFIGYSGRSGWTYGLWAVLVGLGNAVLGALLAWLVLAKRTREVSHRLKTNSMPQLFNLRFNSPAMKIFASIIIFIFMIPYSASVYKGLSSVCSVVLGISPEICMIIIAVASAVLLIFGGYLATLKADFIQGIVMMIGVAALIVTIVTSSNVGGLTEGISRLGNKMNGVKIDTIGLVAMILMTSFGTWGLPHMIHKYYAIKDDKEIKRGTWASTFFCVLVAGGGYFIGSFSRLFFDELPKGGTDFLIPNMLNEAGLSNILLGIILVLLISASVTTLSSLTLASCSTVSMDLIKGTFKKDLSDKSTLLLTRVLCFAFILLSYTLAHSETGIVELMSYSWGIISGSFLAPYMLSLYWKGMNKAGGWTGMLAGFCIAMFPVIYIVILKNAATPIINGPVFAVSAMALSFVFCIIGTFVARAIGKGDEVNEFFYSGTVRED